MGKGPLTGLAHGWARRGPWSILLWPLARLYGALVIVRRSLYRAGVFQVHHAQLPVVIVGNLVAGGAGKTPVVVELVRYLAARGLRPGILSRGYGRSASHCVEVMPDSAVAQVGDEPLLLRRKTGAPVFVARSRFEAARKLRLRHPEVNVLVSDDGLQHYALHRDVEICVFDERGVGNGWLLPAGPLREAWPRNCDIVLDSGALIAANRFAVRRRLGGFALRSDGTAVALSGLRDTAGEPGKPIWAMAGIAQPEQFFSMLRAVGIVLKGSIALADHADVLPRDLERAVGSCLLCTEKDAAKVWTLRPDALAVPLEVDIDPAFWAALEALLLARTGTKLSLPDGYPPA